LKTKRVSPHVLRHSTAMNLLQHGVDRSVIALWLGHESMDTTQIYLHASLELKEKALAKTERSRPASTVSSTRPALGLPASPLIMPSENVKKGRFLKILKNRPVCSALSSAQKNNPYGRARHKGYFYQ